MGLNMFNWVIDTLYVLNFSYHNKAIYFMQCVEMKHFLHYNESSADM